MHGASVEKIAMGLVCSVETFKGGNISLVKRNSGFNGLSIYNNGEVRKIELKSMERSDYWIAINGFIAIDKLFFERDYWLYFALLPENIILMAKGLPFIKQQLNLSKELQFLNELEEWIKSSKKLSKSSGMKFIPRINLKFGKPIRKLVNELISGSYDKDWNYCVAEIWINEGSWKKIFESPEFVD